MILIRFLIQMILVALMVWTCVQMTEKHEFILECKKHIQINEDYCYKLKFRMCIEETQYDRWLYESQIGCWEYVNQ